VGAEVKRNMQAHPYAANTAGHAGPPLVAVTICRHCGVVAPAEGHTCEVCKRPLAELRGPAPAQPADHCWVAVRCGFTCNSCRFLAPLDTLDADGAVECAHCGLRQRFDVHIWQEALAFAHAVGDLAGPNAEGRNPHPVLWIGSENPHVKTGTTRTFEHETFGALAVDAAPGHPVCGRCREPVALFVPRPGAVETACPRCGDRATHAISDAAVGLYPALVAAVSEEHRRDRPKARAAATAAGVLSLSCPACGAPLELTESGTVQTCRYCRASCVVPHQSVARALRKTPEPAVWWLFFQGASEARKSLLSTPSVQARAQGESAKQALKLLKLGKSQGIGDAPGVYEAPEAKGRNYLQAALTLALGAIALAVALGIVLAASALSGN
jgi:hypothetical protein